MDLDTIDNALLDVLQADGRASYESLGHAVGLSRVAARNRVRRLVDGGAIQIITAVHPSVRGLNVLGHLSIRVDASAGPVADAIAAMPEFPLVSEVTGTSAVIAEVRTATLADLHGAVRRVRSVDGVVQVGTCLYSERLKDRHVGNAALARTPDRPIDGVDHRLVELLQQNGRASFGELGERAGISATSARTRVVNLIRSGAIHVGAILQPGRAGLGHMCGFGLLTDGSAGVARSLVNLPGVHYLTECVGEWDALGTLLSPGQSETARALDDIRATPGVRAVTSWTHLRVVKEDYRLPPVTS